MVAQFTQQDPLSSGSGGGGSSGTSDYVNQLMSMTNLTTMQTMSAQMTTSTGQQALALAQSLPGSTVEVSDGKGNVVAGVVQKASVDTTTDNVVMTINGQQYSSANLISIDQTAATTPTP
jgi:flagellar hook assembly protein FlgD